MRHPSEGFPYIVYQSSAAPFRKKKPPQSRSSGIDIVLQNYLYLGQFSCFNRLCGIVTRCSRLGSCFVYGSKVGRVSMRSLAHRGHRSKTGGHCRLEINEETLEKYFTRSIEALGFTLHLQFGRLIWFVFSCKVASLPSSKLHPFGILLEFTSSYWLNELRFSWLPNPARKIPLISATFSRRFSQIRTCISTNPVVLQRRTRPQLTKRVIGP